jgi:hypothetical protein
VADNPPPSGRAGKMDAQMTVTTLIPNEPDTGSEQGENIARLNPPKS